MSDYFHESLGDLTNGDESIGTQPDMETALAYAFWRIATNGDLEREDKAALVDEAKAEAIRFGLDNERIEKTYTTVMDHLAAHTGEAGQEPLGQLNNEEE
jgi:hypothetical protein